MVLNGVSLLKKTAFSFLMWILFPDEEVAGFIGALANKNSYVLWILGKLGLWKKVSLLSKIRVYEGRPQNPIKQFSKNMICYPFCLGCQYLILIWCRAFVGPILGGFLNEELGFEWATAIQGGWPLLSVSNYTFFYIYCSYELLHKVVIITTIVTGCFFKGSCNWNILHHWGNKKKVCWDIYSLFCLQSYKANL